MARKMNIKSELKLSSKEAINNVRALTEELANLQKKYKDSPITVAARVTIDGNALRSLQAKVRRAFANIPLTVTASGTTTEIGKTQNIKQTTQDAQIAYQNIVKTEQKAISAMRGLVNQAGSDMAAASNLASAGIQRSLNQVQALEAYSKRLRAQTFQFYSGGEEGFNQDMDKLSTPNWGKYLPALVQSNELMATMDGRMAEFVAESDQAQENVTKIGNKLGEWDEVLEGDVVDNLNNEFYDLRGVFTGTQDIIVDGAIDMTDKLKALGRQVKNIGDGIKSFGRTMRGLGGTFTKFSSIGLNLVKNIGMGVAGAVTILGYSTQQMVADTIESTKKLEYARTGLYNQFTRKEIGFDVDEYIARIRETAKKTMGLSAGDLADYLNQIAPVSDNSSQAYDVTMGLLKTITYGGGDPSTDMGYMIKNIRDVLAKGQAYQMDINQFNRAAPILRDLLREMGLDQFIKNGQINITKDNVDEMMDAFSKLNDPSSPVYGILDDMSNTLGGLIEESKETLSQSIEDALRDSGLLDVWKSILRNDTLSNFIKTTFSGIGNFVGGILKQLDGDRILKAVIGLFTHIGDEVREKIMPSLKKALGLDENAGLTDVIVKMIDLFGRFITGMANGVSWLLDKVWPVFKAIGEGILEILKKLHIEGGDLATLFGFLTTTGWAFGLVLKTLGGLSNLVGNKFKKWGQNIVNNPNGTASNNDGGLFRTMAQYLGQSMGNSKVGQFVKGRVSLVGAKASKALADITGRTITGKGLLTSAGIALVGHAVSEPLSNAIGKNNPYLKDVTKNLVDLGSTFASVSKVAGPLPGVIVTFVESLTKAYKILKDNYEIQQESKKQTRKASLDTLQTQYKNTILGTMREAGFFAYEDENSEDAMLEVIERASKLSGKENPADVLKELKEIYLEHYSDNVVADDFEAYMKRISNPEDEGYIIGSHKLNGQNAGTENNTAKLRSIVDNLLDLNMLEPGTYNLDALSAYNGVELWNFLRNHGVEINSVEHLNALANRAGYNVQQKNDLKNKGNEVGFGYYSYDEEGNKTWNKIEDISELMTKLGFAKSTDGEWSTTSKINLDIDEESQKLAHDALINSLTIPGLLDADGKLNIKPTLTIKPKTKQDFVKELLGVYKTAQDASGQITYKITTEDPQQRLGKLQTENRVPSLAEQLGYPRPKAAGGFIRPIYRAGGGGAKGVDTVPAMLSPGEFVQKASAVAKAGLGVMQALNMGDLSQAYKLIGAKINSNNRNYHTGWVNNNNSRSQQINHTTIYNQNRSGRISTYRGLKNRVATF